mgnify:CR=1 FL=1
MKKKIIAIIAASALTATVVGCSKEQKNEEINTTQNNSTQIEKNSDASTYQTDVSNDTSNQPQEPLMNEDQQEANDLFAFYAAHNQFGKYVKSVEKRGNTIILSLGDTYDEMKKSQPFNIRYNKATFPELYQSHVKNNDYSDLNAYLITRTAYTLANYSDIDRVVVNVPKDSAGKYYVADVSRDDVNLVLGFDVDTLKKGPKEDEGDLGEDFTTKFANEYTYKQSDDFTDSNTRYINKFIRKSDAPTKVDDDAVAIINTYYLPIEERPTMIKLFRDATDDILYTQYITDDFDVTSDGIELALSPKIVDEKGKEETEKALTYISGRLLANFPQLQNVTITAGSETLKVNRDKLTDLIGYDISTLVDVDGAEIDNWNEWASKFANVYTAGDKLNQYVSTFSK